MPNYRFYSNDLEHSTGLWEKHKYLKKIGNKYIYSVKRSIETRKNLKTANKELEETRTRQALSTNPNYQREYAARQKRDELQRQYDRTALGRAEKGLKSVGKRLSALGPKAAHKVSWSHSDVSDHTINVKDLEKKKKKK